MVGRGRGGVGKILYNLFYTITQKNNHMINPDTAWALIKSNALKALKTQLIWHSLRQGKQYKLIAVHDDHLIIQREGDANPQTLTSARVRQAALDFNRNNCIVKRRTLISPTVAEETAFVLFHPQLTWDDTNENIIQTA